MRNRDRASQPHGGAPSAAKQKVFRLIVIAFPVFFFVVLELCLRFFHYGPDLRLFMAEPMAGKTYLVMNPEVKNRYFARVPFSPSTSPDFFSPVKVPGTFRIFCLGGSTTVGYPYWYNGSFSSFLRDRLHRVFPEKTFEVVNMGMTATNSFTVNDMARELVNYEPDLFIVYDGHNEFYGALGVASNESIGRARWITDIYLRAIHLKTVLLLRSVITGIAGLFSADVAELPGSTMMERLAYGQLVPYGSSLYAAGLAAYRSNLEDLKQLGASHGVPVILGSQVSNLRDLPPFVSVHPQDMSGASRAAFDFRVGAGLSNCRSGRIDSAIVSFRAAAALDPGYALVHFQMAQCLDSAGRRDEALPEYVRARDLDQLRFRAGSDFNNALKGECDRPGFVFVDMEKAFSSRSPDRIVGSSLIVEHLHPNARGFFLMAREYAQAMRKAGLVASEKEWAERDTVNEDALWEERCLTPIDDMMAARRTAILTSGWPFKSQVPTVDAVPAGDTLGQVVEKVTRGQWNWLQAHDAAVEYYLGRRELRHAEREYLTIINQLPLYDAGPYLALAKMYIDASRLDAARNMLLGSLTIKPSILAYRALGDISLRTERPAEAAAYYDRTFAFPQSPPERVENGYLLALALSRAGNKARASQELLNVLNIRPDYGPAAKLLSELRSKPAR